MPHFPVGIKESRIPTNYLTADYRDDDVLELSAAPAQDVGALFVALMTQLLDSKLCTGDGKKRNWEL